MVLFRYTRIVYILGWKWGFGPKRNDNRDWRRFHNEELHSWYRSPNIVRAIKSRSLKWAGYVAIMEEGRSAMELVNIQYIHITVLLV